MKINYKLVRAVGRKLQSHKSSLCIVESQVVLELKRIHTKAIDKDRKAGSCQHEGPMPFASAAHASMREQGGYKEQEPLGT